MGLYLRVLAAIFACGAIASGQPLVEFGLKVGVPVAQTFQTNSWGFLATGTYQGASATRRYTAGASLGLRLPHGFGAEFDFLYKRLGFDTYISLPPFDGVVYTHAWTTANSWEFPALGVYRFSHWEKIRPRISGGISFRAVNGVSSTSECYTEAAGLCGPSPSPVAGSSENQGILNARSHVGAVVAAGVEKRIGRIRLVPEIRFTRWRADGAELEYPEFTVRSNPNQVDVLLGIGF